MVSFVGRLCEGHVALRYTPRFKTKRRLLRFPVMKLHGSDNRGGIIVKTYKEHLLTFIFKVPSKLTIQLEWKVSWS